MSGQIFLNRVNRQETIADIYKKVLGLDINGLSQGDKTTQPRSGVSDEYEKYSLVLPGTQ